LRRFRRRRVGTNARFGEFGVEARALGVSFGVPRFDFRGIIAPLGGRREERERETVAARVVFSLRAGGEHKDFPRRLKIRGKNVASSEIDPTRLRVENGTLARVASLRKGMRQSDVGKGAESCEEKSKIFGKKGNGATDGA
jgi:hypothetical protein